MNYYEEIKEKLIDNEVYERIKDYSKERHRVRVYYEVGELLASAGKHYGENIIGDYSKKLVNEVGKKYNKNILFRMRKFYNIFKDEKVATVWQQLTWSHCRTLISLNSVDKINYYINQIKNRNLSVRQLERIIKEKEYERLSEETKIKLIEHKELEILDEIKEPIIIHNKNIEIDKITEKVLKEWILDNISDFMKQLGNGYAFIDSEYKIKIGNTFNYIDILLYNYIYKCFVVVELKVTELKKEHIGQVQVYMNYVDSNLKNIGDNKTIGLIVVKENNKYVIKYSSDKRIKSIEYSMEV